MKIHATGFPDWCKTEKDEQEYIDQCWDRFNIRIIREKMIPNPAKRYIAK